MKKPDMSWWGEW